MLPATNPGTGPDRDAISCNSFASRRELARDHFHHVAEPAGGQRFPDWIRRRHITSAKLPHFPSSLRTICVPSTMACILAKATSRGKWKQPQSGSTAIRSGRHHFQRSANVLRHHLRRLDVVVLDVDHAHAQFERRLELPEKIQILAAAARKFQSQLLDFARPESPGKDSGSCPPRKACRSGCRNRCEARSWRPRLPPAYSTPSRPSEMSSGKPE